MRIGVTSGILTRITDTTRAAMGNAGVAALIVGIRSSFKETLLPIEGGISAGEKGGRIISSDGHRAVIIVAEDVVTIVRRGAGGVGTVVPNVL
jgi:hypothetical protein